MTRNSQVPPQHPDRTYCQLPIWPFDRWEPEVRVAWFGSCFAERVGQRMADAGLETLINPLGIGFNPVSISRMVTAGVNDLLQPIYDPHRQRWYSFQAHSRISGQTEAALANMLESACETRDKYLKNADVIVITLGTAFAWHIIEQVGPSAIVANCHKQPGQLFERKLLSVQTIVDHLTAVVEKYPNHKIILTVSPVRHTKETLQGNNQSKASLILAAHQLCASNPGQCWYFPSYELVIDDLRDYRYYEADMIHPNQQAIEYVWSAFGQQIFSEQLLEQLRSKEQELKRLAHRTIS